MKSPRTYTAGRKRAASRRVLDIGPAAASREPGVSPCSRYDWRRKVPPAAAGQGDRPATGFIADELRSAEERRVVDAVERSSDPDPARQQPAWGQLPRGGGGTAS